MHKIIPLTTALSPILATASATNSNDGGIFGKIAELAVTIIESLGGIGIAILIALENIFPPIPSEAILPLAGFTASKGTSFSLFEAIAWATAGSLIGAFALYGIARLFGRKRTRWFLGKLPFMETSDIDKTEAFFEKHERSAVFFGRMLPIFRSLISLPAGVVKMSLPLFTVFTAIGSAIWNTVLIGAGYALGENWNEVAVYLGVFSKIVLGVILIAAIVWIVKKIQARKQRKISTDSPDADLG